MADWQQDFPTYNYESKDILVAEYENAAQTAQSEERVFANATNVTAAVSAGFGSLAIGSSSDWLGNFLPLADGEIGVSAAIIAVVIVYSIATLIYFADRQKSITYAKRKIIVLRRMLGLSYGSFQLALPNDRIEGADLPFNIRLFPSWFSYVAYPFWIVTAFSAVVIWFLGGRIISSLADEINLKVFFGVPSWLLLSIVGVWILITAFVYRYLLYDTHENPFLSFAQILATAFGLGVIRNTEHVIYEAKLAIEEHRRMHFDLEPFYETLLFLEDRTFRSHPGLSLRGLGRAALTYFGRKRRSGGSTITQQLARTLLITQFHKTIRRKIVEVPLALWLESIFNKNEILELYLVSVRFAHDTYGVLEASRYFFEPAKPELTKAKIFFLIERISNVRDDVLTSKVDDTLRQSVEEEIISREEASDVVRIYRKMAKQGKLDPSDPDGVRRLIKKWS